MSSSHPEESVQDQTVASLQQRHSILLVDDEQENLDVLQALLEDRWIVHTARSGEAALQLLEERISIDLVIADQRMTGISGVELLSRIAEQNPETMRIILTGYSDVEPMLQAIERGAVYSFLVKPYDPQELRGVVTEALRAQAKTRLLHRLVDARCARRDSLNRAADELRNTQEELLAAERMSAVGQATTGIVHNLRNLGTIMNVLVLEIRQQTHDSAMLTLAEESYAALSSLIRVLENIRDFARLGESIPTLRPTDVVGFLKRTTTLALMQEHRAQCPVEVEADPELRVVPLDTESMSLAVLALVDNAMRASDPGSPVHISVRRVRKPDSHALDATANDWACIEVSDQGHGMDGATLARVVRPFFSGFSPQSMGLGLETARLAARVHGGELKLDSVTGKGTRARLLFPVRGVA